MAHSLRRSVITSVRRESRLVEIITLQEVRSRAARVLHAGASDVAYIGQLLRRAVDIHAPASRFKVESAVCEIVAGMQSETSWSEVVADCLDDLIQYGDVFEARIPNPDTGRAAFRLRPAPAAYVRRKDGSAILLGVAGDELAPGESEWGDRLSFHGVLRMLSRGPETDALIASLNIPELKESLWLRAPRSMTAAAFVELWHTQIVAQAPCGTVDGLELLDGAGPKRGRRQRWSIPTPRDSGLFVARRAQPYNATPRWCAVRIESGVPAKLLDLAADGDVERPCDLAWRLKAALDANARKAQKMRLNNLADMVRIDFFQPIPSWAERRLTVAAQKAGRADCLFSFEMSSAEADVQVDFLREMLWLEPEGRSAQ